MSAVLQLRIGRGTVRGEVLRRGKRVWAGEASFMDVAELGDIIAALAAESPVPAQRLRLRVTLESPPVQVRSLHNLPPVNGRALRTLVANQTHRFFRKNGKRVVTDAAWAHRGRRGSSSAAVAAAVEEPWLDAITAGADAAGLRLETISPVAELTAARLDLITAPERARRRRRDLLALRRLGFVAALLWSLAGALLIARVHRERRQIELELASLKEPAAALLNLRRELGEATLTIQTIDHADSHRETILRQVAGVAVALPDSAYLTSLTLDREGRGTLTGAAPQAASVVAALDGNGVTIGPRLTGPVVREAAAGRRRERFTISFGPPRVK